MAESQRLRLVSHAREHFLGWDLVLVLAIFFGIVAWVEFFGGDRLLDSLLAENRSALYSVLASLWGALLGFAITAVSIVLGFSQTERLAIVRESRHYSTLWAVFLSAIRFLGAATAAAIAALLLDRDSPPGTPNRLFFYLALVTTLLAASRLARCVWILEKVVRLVSKPSNPHID